MNEVRKIAHHGQAPSHEDYSRRRSSIKNKQSNMVSKHVLIEQPYSTAKGSKLPVIRQSQETGQKQGRSKTYIQRYKQLE